MLGTKCPSITSRWIQSAPAAAISARTSSPSLAKSADRIDGAMLITGLDTRRSPLWWPNAAVPMAAVRARVNASPAESQKIQVLHVP